MDVSLDLSPNETTTPENPHFRAYTTENILKVTSLHNAEASKNHGVTVQHKEVDPQRNLIGSSYAWNIKPATELNRNRAGLSRFTRQRRNSESSNGSVVITGLDQPVKIKGAISSVDRFIQEILGPLLRDLFSLTWLSFVLCACAMVAKFGYSARFVILLIAAFSYCISNFVVWLIIHPISSGTLKVRLWLSHKKWKRLEHQIDYGFERGRAPKTGQKERRRRSSSNRPQGVLSPKPRASIFRTQSALGALPMLVWSSQTTTASPIRLAANTTRRATAQADLGVNSGGGARLSRWRPSGLSTPLGQGVAGSHDFHSIVQAISQPEIGWMDKQGPGMGGSATFNTRRLPQIREDRAREAGRIFSEGDWQAMLDVEAAAGATSKSEALQDWCVLTRGRIHHLILRLSFHPSIILAMILRNTAWCAIFLWALTQITRTSYLDSWDYSEVSRTFWWLESVFQWQLSMDYVLGYLAASEKIKYLLSWPALVDIVSLPAMQVVIEAVSGQSLAYYTTTFGAIRFFRLFRMEKQIANIFPWLEAVRLIIMGLAVDTGVIVLTFACCMWVAEGPQPDRDFVSVLDYVYYSIVTMTTVGYGDYSPTTRVARWITSAAILAGFIIFPYHVQRLLQSFHIPPVVVGHMPSVTSDFILVFGKMRPRQLACMVHELCEALPGSVRHLLVVTPFPAASFRPLVQNILRQHRLHVCVSQKCPTSDEMQVYCALARAVFVIADPKPQAPRFKGHPTWTYPALLAEDQKAFLRVAKAQPWCWPTVPIAVQLAHGMYSGLTMELGAYHVIPLEWLKLKAIAKSVAGCQGFIPLCFNLYHTPAKSSLIWNLFESIESRKEALESCMTGKDKTSPTKSQYGHVENCATATGSTQSRAPPSDEVTIKVTGKKNLENQHVSISDDEEDSEESNRNRRWFSRRRTSFSSRGRNLTSREIDSIRDELNFYYYVRGLQYQVYRFDFPSCMHGIDFSLAVRLLYRRFNVFLIGLVSIDKRFVMSPIGYTISLESQFNPMAIPFAGIVLAPSLHDVNNLAKLRVFHISTSTIEAERKFLSRNLRSQDDFRAAAVSFMEEVSKIPAETNNDEWDAVPRREGTQTSTQIRGDASTDLHTPSRLADEAIIREVVSAVEAFELSSGIKPFILCCGWPKDVYQFLSAIEANRSSFVLILAAQDAPAYARWDHELWDYRNSCVWLHGSPLNLEDLKNAGALLAEAIVILAARHGFSESEGEESVQLTTVDNQTILVRQQVLALFARVNEYISAWHDGDIATPNASLPINEKPGLLERSRVRVPLIITELQDKESVENLSSPKDIFLLSAFRTLQGRQGRLDAFSSSLFSRLSGRDTGDDAEWAAEGGRGQDTSSSGVFFDATRSPTDSSAYTIQSEFRSGRLYLRELTYSLIAFCLPVSRFAVDTTFIEHLVDGSHTPLGDLINKRIKGHPQLQRYRIRSPLSLIPIPKMFVGAPFKDAFSYLMKMELKIALAILRKIGRRSAVVASPMDSKGGTEPQEFVISCPEPSLCLEPEDRIYVLNACPKHLAGLIFYETAVSPGDHKIF